MYELDAIRAALPNWAAIAPLLTPLTVLAFGWKARGFFESLVNNHLAHAKQDIINAVREGVEVEDVGHKAIATAVQHSSERIIDTMINLHHK